MLGSYARAAMLGFALWAAAGAARADDLSDFNAAAEAAEAHNRVAIGYLRTGNADLASLEIERLREAWGKVGAVKRPAAFDGKLYVAMLTDASMRLVTADMLLNSGRPDNARQALEAIRADLYNLRTSAGIVVLSDCIRDSSAAMDALMVYNTRELDWSKPETAAQVTEKSTAYEKYARPLQCNSIRRRAQGAGIPPPDRRRQRRPRAHPAGGQDARHRPLASRADPIAFVRQFAGVSLRLTITPRAPSQSES